MVVFSSDLTRLFQCTIQSVAFPDLMRSSWCTTVPKLLVSIEFLLIHHAGSDQHFKGLFTRQANFDTNTNTKAT